MCSFDLRAQYHSKSFITIKINYAYYDNSILMYYISFYYTWYLRTCWMNSTCYDISGCLWLKYSRLIPRYYIYRSCTSNTLSTISHRQWSISVQNTSMERPGSGCVAHGISIRIGREDFELTMYILYILRLIFTISWPCIITTLPHKLMLYYLISLLHKL